MKPGAAGRKLAALLVLVAFWMLAHGAPALAHAELQRTSPAEGDTLSEQPGEVRLDFDEPVRAEFDPIQVTDENGDRVDEDDGQTLADDPDIVVVGLGELPEGNYTVEWSVTSADGDPVGAEFGFAVGDSAVDAEGGGEEEPTATAKDRAACPWARSWASCWSAASWSGASWCYAGASPRHKPGYRMAST